MSDESFKADLVDEARRADVALALSTVEALIGDSMRQIADEFRIEEIVADVDRKSPEELAAIRADVQRVQRFLTAALVAHRASGEPTGVHVDGQMVPRELVSVLLDLHPDTAERAQQPASMITVVGLRIRFVVEADAPPTVAFVDASGTAHRFTLEQVPGALAILERPNVLTIVARMRLMIDQLDRIISGISGPPE